MRICLVSMRRAGVTVTCQDYNMNSLYYDIRIYRDIGVQVFVI